MRHRRKILAALLALLLLTLCACSAKTEPAPAAQQEETVQQETAAPQTQPQPEKNETASAQEETQLTPSQEQADETAEAAPAEPEVRAPMDEQPKPQPAAQDVPLTCTISISCATILDHSDDLDPEKLELVPADGWILAPVEVAFTQGQSVFDVLLDTVKANAVHMEYQNSPMYKTAYIEGIGNLYEFDCGELSGWMYRVNGWFPNYGCSRYAVQAGDVIEWLYTCDLGSDIGGGGIVQTDE